MNSVSEDVKDMLEDKSELGLVFSENLFIGREPTTPDDCVTLFDTPGSNPQLTLDNAAYEYPSMQIRVRSNDYSTGYALAEDIKTSLHGQAQETWNGTLYSVIQVSNGPFLLGWDDNDRCLFIINLTMQRR